MNEVQRIIRKTNLSEIIEILVLKYTPHVFLNWKENFKLLMYMGKLSCLEKYHVSNISTNHMKNTRRVNDMAEIFHWFAKSPVITYIMN